jgi:hypothetical protein
MQPAPNWMQCPQSNRGNGHLFEFLCHETGKIHHYKYNLLGLQVTYWPIDPKYNDSKQHVVITSIHPYKTIYAGSTTRNFIDFPQVTDYLKLLSVFS